MKALKLAAAVILSLTLTGCVGREPNEIAYIVALGIDSAENGNYEITIQYANPNNISGGGEDGPSDENKVENLIIEAPNIYAAVGLANQIDSKMFSLSHTKLVVFSQEVAKNGLKDISELFIRSEELRPDIYLAVAAEGAGEYLQAVNPAMEINPAKYYQLIFDKNKNVGLPEGTEKNFFFGIETGDYDSLLPLAGVIKEEGSEAPVNNNAFEYKMRNYTAGQNAIIPERDTEAIGSAIFSGDKMVGVLGSIETEIYKLLDRDYNSGYITIYNEKTPSVPVTVKLFQRRNPKYDIDIENKIITVSLFLDGDIYSIPSGYNIEGDLDSFEDNSQMYIENACGNFMREFIREYNSDIFHLKEKCKTKFLTNEDYYNYRDNASYKDFEVNIKVDLDIRRTGLVVREV